MALTKLYTKSPCALDRLIQEISQDASITIALDLAETSLLGDQLTVAFKADMSDWTAVDALVTAHGGLPLPHNEIQAVSVSQEDPNTGGLLLTPKFAPPGWRQQYFETEFESSKLNSIHEKNAANVDIGFSSLKFFDAADVELTDQLDIDASCVMTQLDWMPTHDYAIKSGFVAQIQSPAENLYVWVQGVVLPAAYGGAQATFAEGGINLMFMDAKTLVGLDGVSATVLYYAHPQLGPGVGTNKLRMIVRHSAGFRHRLQFVLEIFTP